MTVLDVFNDDVFGVVSLTTSLDKLPYIPSLLGRSKLFSEKGITTTSAMIEERHGKLSLVQTAARGAPGETRSRRTRKTRSFSVPHLPVEDAVSADEVQNVRAFGSESNVEGVASVVNEKLARMKQDHEVTWERHRVSALHGILLDADGSTLFNWFTEFGITETVKNFVFSVATTNLKDVALSVIRAMDLALGGTPYKGITAYCGDIFYDKLVSHATTATAYDRFQNGAFFREQQGNTGITGDGGFFYAGITWINYRGAIGGTKFVLDDIARFVPTGTPNVFERFNAPADFIETVNTIGRSMYAKQERQKFDRGIDLHTQSNPLHIVTRPAVLIKGTHS